MDLAAIGDALATKYAGLGPPAGETLAIRDSTADPPAQLGPLPCCVVFLDQGDLAEGNGTRIGVVTYLARIYIVQATDTDLERAMRRAARWASLAMDAHGSGVKLGIPAVVAQAVASGFRVGVMPYAGVSYVGAETRIKVTTSEPWTPVA